MTPGHEHLDPGGVKVLGAGVASGVDTFVTFDRLTSWKTQVCPRPCLSLWGNREISWPGFGVVLQERVPLPEARRGGESAITSPIDTPRSIGSRCGCSNFALDQRQHSGRRLRSDGWKDQPT